MPTSGIGEWTNRLFRKPTGAPPPNTWNTRLAAAVREGNLVDERVLAQAEDLSRRIGRSLGQTLLDMGVVSHEQLFSVYAHLTDLPLWNGRGVVNEDTPFTPEFLVYNRVLPISADGTASYVISDPEDDGLTDMLRRLAPDAALAIAPADEIEFRLQSHFELEKQTSAEAETVTSVEHLKDLALEAPIIRQVNDIIANGAKMGASDIHLEPSQNRIELRYRVDGILHSRPAPSVSDYPAVVSRMKILAQLDIAERRLPQDGRIRFRAAGRDVDIRVSTVPTGVGEDVTLRLLDQSKQILDLDRLGLSPSFVLEFRQCLRHSHGLVLVTGPTGSGKSTCLYSGLKDIIDGRVKIITVEDPVEYQLPGLTQIQVNADIGMTFAGALRAILRHDPDIIFVGEIRDRETAEIAVQAALTGHLVLSTIHTNSAAGAIGRLLNMGVPDYLVSSSVLAISGQRLVRRLCTACARERTLDSTLAARFNLPSGTLVREAAGCPECGDIGYRGRMPIAELLVFDTAMRQQVLASPTADNLLVTARQGGFRTMLEDGIHRVLAGETTVEEVLRVAR